MCSACPVDMSSIEKGIRDIILRSHGILRILQRVAGQLAFVYGIGQYEYMRRRMSRRRQVWYMKIYSF